MEKHAPKNGRFFICFVMFTSTFVYSVIWNQSTINVYFTPDTYSYITSLKYIHIINGSISSEVSMHIYDFKVGIYYAERNIKYIPQYYETPDH